MWGEDLIKDGREPLKLLPNKSEGGMQKFDTGATRSADEHKHDFEGFLSPTALEAYGDYMTRHRYQRDGTLRASDNWQKGIPLHKYMSSLVRHVFDLWRAWRGTTVYDKDSGERMTLLDIASAILFNVQGFMHEVIKHHGDKAYVVCDATREAIKEGREFGFYECTKETDPMAPYNVGYNFVPAKGNINKAVDPRDGDTYVR